MFPATRSQAMALLGRVGAPPRLIRHAELVGEAADALIGGLRPLELGIHSDLIRVGAALHDVGKTLHPDELERPGSAHEPAGERLLLSAGATPEVARICRTHAQWRGPGVSIEELFVALSDKLWKGARVTELEDLVVDRVAGDLRRDRWEVFLLLDPLFEEVAAGADDRLGRSAVV